MNTHPTKPAKRTPRKVRRDVPAPVEPVRPAGPFFSFRSSYMELTTAGRGARVKARHARFEDGKLVAETFDGELDRSAYDAMVHAAQRYVCAQSAQFFEALSAFLPTPSKSSRDLD